MRRLAARRGGGAPWPHVNFLLFILTAAYRDFEARVGDTRSPRGAKTDLVVAALRRLASPFRVAELQHACPGVSVDLIRRVLKDLRRRGLVECLGRGTHAQWRNTAKWESGNTLQLGNPMGNNPSLARR